MIFYEKKIAETPLEMLDRLRIEKPEFKDSKLSYAGRLDPMANGQMLVLIDEENKDYKRYLGFDKEYEAMFLLGVESDTGDALGIIKREDSKTDFLKENIQKQIERQIVDFKKIKKQKYPWFSSMTVAGLKLFDHFKKGNLNIERPTREIEIKAVDEIEFSKIENLELQKYIFENIEKVKGDFRQKEIIERWNEFFQNNQKDFLVVKVKILVSSGTYIRSLTENFEYPAILLKLKRTKIFV